MRVRTVGRWNTLATRVGTEPPRERRGMCGYTEMNNPVPTRCATSQHAINGRIPERKSAVYSHGAWLYLYTSTSAHAEGRCIELYSVYDLSTLSNVYALYTVSKAVYVDSVRGTRRVLPNMYSLYNGGYASYTAIIQRNRIQPTMQDLYSRGALSTYTARQRQRDMTGRP